MEKKEKKARKDVRKNLVYYTTDCEMFKWPTAHYLNGYNVTILFYMEYNNK